MACCNDPGQPAKLNYIGLQEPRPAVTITVSVVLHNKQRVTQLRIGMGSSCLPVAVQVNVNKTTSVIPTASVIQPITIIINTPPVEASWFNYLGDPLNTRPW